MGACSLPDARPRISVEAAALSDSWDMPTVPAHAVLRLHRGAYVYVVEQAGAGDTVVELLPVSVGAVDNQRAAIAAGLEPGVLVATAGIHQLRDGASVRVVDRN